MRIVLLCHFSNSMVRDYLPLKLSIINKLICRFKHVSPTPKVDDVAIWDTNAIYELSKYSESIELHVISPHNHLAHRLVEFTIDGVNYHFFRNVSNFQELIQRHFIKGLNISYRKERRQVHNLINTINPSLVHVIGAENPSYSICAIDIPQTIPVIVQLQTLLSDTSFIKNYSINPKLYKYRKEIETLVIRRANYLATKVPYYRSIIVNNIKPDACFLETTLPLAEPLNLTNNHKEYDFVYYSANINKAADYAIEAFIIASKKHPGITLDIVGGYTDDYRVQLEERLECAGVSVNVFFEGKLPTHQDVINQIRKSRFALLPLKIDWVSGTIRESMANGLPVITSITAGTPTLNEKRQCVLLSEIGDYQAMADNMCRLLENSQLAELLRKNGGLYMKESCSNEAIIRDWVINYNAIVDGK